MSTTGKISRDSSIAALLTIYVLFGFAQASNEFRVLFLEGQGMTATECGRVLAAASLLSAIARSLSGALADKLRSRRIVCIGAQVLFITCKNPYVIMGSTVLNGFAAGISLASTAVYLRMLAPAGLDTTTLSLNTVMSSLGAIVINLASGVIVDSLGIFTVYRISLAFLLVWLVLYFGTWSFGTQVLKEKPPVPMLITHSGRSGGK